MIDEVAPDKVAQRPLPTAAIEERPGLIGFLFGDRYESRPAKQYLESLQTKFLTIIARPDPGYSQGVVDEISRTLKKYENPDVSWPIASDAWDDAQRVERLMVNILDGREVEVELERRLLEAQDLKLKATEFYRGRMVKSEPNKEFAAEQVETNRALLARLTDDLHWFYGQRELKRRYAHQAQQRVLAMFLIAFLAFGFVLYSLFNLSTDARTFAANHAPPAPTTEETSSIPGE